MKTVYTFLIFLSIMVLSISQMYLWKDQKEMWQQFEIHLNLEKAWNRHYEKASHTLDL